MSTPSLLKALKEQTQRVLNYRCDDGYFPGRLSSSALATAVTLRALMSVDASRFSTEINQSLGWLVDTQRDDGSWGDTPISSGNISTTLLCYSVIPDEDPYRTCRTAAAGAIETAAGSLKGDDVQACILKRYGHDRTFSAPILALAAISETLGDDPWSRVPQLPFELAALPQWVFRFLKLDVVSYAVPALIAIGLVRHMNRARRFSPLCLLRNRLIPGLLDRLSTMQPANGGFLEAAPLTAFVTMSLAEAGYKDHVVVEKGIDFLLASRRDDGSVPIDTNLETWLTSQALKALDPKEFTEPEKETVITWYLDQQFTAVHPFTRAAPGGWGWTALPGSVPDADDTAGALLALRKLTPQAHTISTPVRAGIQWLIGLQNTDGGIPTFCRGWGKLPFDQSCPDITGHVLEALSVWYDSADSELQNQVRRCAVHCLNYLAAVQQPDGSWLPLWFGNEHHVSDANPCYGTAMVLDSLHALHGAFDNESVATMKERGKVWLWANQNEDGSWGGAKGISGSREETALAMIALAGSEAELIKPLENAVNWLLDNPDLPPAPIGLYFASLWYYERLYPEIFTLRALRIANSLA